MSDAHFHRCEHRIEDQEDQQHSKRDDNREPRRRTLLRFVLTGPIDIEFFHRRSLIEQHHELNLGGPEVNDRGLVVRFEIEFAAIPSGVSRSARGRRP
jgi:hypothetical protein